MKRFKTPRGAFFLFLAIGCVLLAYYLITVRIENSKPEDYVQMTKVQEVLSRDLKTNYPQTPKEVIKYYSELTKCFYNESYTDVDFELYGLSYDEINAVRNVFFVARDNDYESVKANHNIVSHIAELAKKSAKSGEREVM